jgi:hypothetical protein
MTSAGAVASNDLKGNAWRQALPWKLAFRLFGVATGVLASVWTGAFVAAAQDLGYRSAAAAPVAWLTFAKELQGRFEQRLASDDDGARRIQDAMGKDDKKSTESVVVRTWVSPGGKIERLEFDGLDNADVAVTLRALLAGVTVGVPPQDMLQPLHLRLSLRAKQQPAESK